MNRYRCLVVLVAVALAAVPATAQKSVRDLYESAKVGTANVAEGIGTVVYDPGAPADTVVALPGGVNLYGNVFDTRNGQPLSPGTVTGVSWYAPAAGTFAVWFAYPANAGTANVATIVYGAAGATFNSVGVTAIAPGAFFLGIDAGYSGSFGSVGLRSASYNNQGFHAAQRYYLGGTLNYLAGQNTMIRAAGSIIVPVELMEFDLVE